MKEINWSTLRFRWNGDEDTYTFTCTTRDADGTERTIHDTVTCAEDELEGYYNWVHENFGHYNFKTTGKAA